VIPFNSPYLVGNEGSAIERVLHSKRLCGDGPTTRECEKLLENAFGFQRSLLTPSCTAALEMAALLIGVGPEDEVIIPSYTFVTSASAFALRGARLIFADSSSDSPNVSVEDILRRVTARTKAIVVVHYGGVAVDLKPLLEICKAKKIFLVEDAAHAVDAKYCGQNLGGIGDLGTFSFHETKNVSCGEGGMLSVNNSDFLDRAEILREKGTNRAAFFRGQIDKYNWVDLGSSYLLPEVSAAMLLVQLQELPKIQARRLQIWNRYSNSLSAELRKIEIQTPIIPDYATNNAHLFYLALRSLKERTDYIDWMKVKGISTVFHYQPLHKSPFYLKSNEYEKLQEAERYGDCLVRLPLYPDLKDANVAQTIEETLSFFST